MLKKSPAPMTTHESAEETVLLRREVNGNKGKDVQRDAVDGNEGILRFTNGRKYNRDVPFELRKSVQGNGVVAAVVSMPFCNKLRMFPQLTLEDVLYA